MSVFGLGITSCQRRFLSYYIGIEKVGKIFSGQSVLCLSTKNGCGSNGSTGKIRWFWMPTGVGLALLTIIQFRHVLLREKRVYSPVETELWNNSGWHWHVNFFRFLPTRLLSRFWGVVHDMELPKFLRLPMIRLWIWIFDCRLDEAEEPDPSKYPNLGAFFTRKLKHGCRTIDEKCDLVSPVDGQVLHFGQVCDGKLEQVKGVPYTVESFFGSRSILPCDEELNQREKLLYQCVFYLGPGDYHHFHSPAEWQVQSRLHFPGSLVSVSPRALCRHRKVFCTNERVSLFGRWKHGFITMTAVGAYNVGSINLHFDRTLMTNCKKRENGNFHEKKFSGNTNLKRGDEVGWFAMGSAIVMIFEAPRDFEFTVKLGQKIKMGQSLGMNKTC